MIISYNLNQKMRSFIHFRGVSGLKLLITPFDPLSPQNCVNGDKLR